MSGGQGGRGGPARRDKNQKTKTIPGGGGSTKEQQRGEYYEGNENVLWLWRQGSGTGLQTGKFGTIQTGGEAGTTIRESQGAGEIERCL